jgi:type II secretory pathway pseudopilin PulG
MNSGRLASSSPVKGFSLIEVTLALGIAGFCLLSIIALLPIGLASNQASVEQTMAANITSSILTDLRCSQPLVTATTSHFGFSVPAAGSGGTIPTPLQTVYLASNGSPTGSMGSVPIAGGTAVSRYRATLGFAPPSGGQRTGTAVRILITWPALSDSNPGKWPANYSGYYEADTTLDRN